MAAENARGGVVSVWSEIDAMQKRFDTELAALKSYVYEVDKRAGNTVRMREDGMLALTYKGTELIAPDCAKLRERFDLLLQEEIRKAEAAKAVAK